MFERLRPRVVVADSYPRKLLPTMTRLGGARLAIETQETRPAPA
ncbi:MAG: hypothetical protein RQ862_04610 [Candidatus Caldarchaeales archaeon]|jgi:hypothetical protein|nr:hypothetical protein [Candidatus Caldarchaeales archaeon]